MQKKREGDFMSTRRAVKIKDQGEVEVEVIIGFQQPAGIKVTLYGTDRRKEKDLGEGVSLDTIPDVFEVAKGADVKKLAGKFVGVFVAITSFNPVATEPASVFSILRQKKEPVPDGTVAVTTNVVNGGAGVVIVYELST
jgi:hypothetical protein